MTTAERASIAVEPTGERPTDEPTMAEGGCLCGAVRYRVVGAPLSSIVCHCATCRRATATPTVAWLTFARTQFSYVTGEAQRYRSSPGVLRRFCALCGSALTYENDKDPQTLDVTTVSLDEPARYPPTREVWVEQRLPWQACDPRLVQYPQGSTP
jgi:hypothetical protein